MSNNKWIKLGGKKEPPEKEEAVIWIPVEGMKNGGYQDKGLLHRIEFGDGGKDYVFVCRGEEVVATHFMIIEKPKE